MRTADQGLALFGQPTVALTQLSARPVDVAKHSSHGVLVAPAIVVVLARAQPPTMNLRAPREP
jgi:hypothetical protein